MNCRQAVALAVMWDSLIDLVVVNPALNSIVEMVRALSRVHRPKVVVIRDPDVEPGIPFGATIDRPDMSTSFSRAQWVERVRELLKELIQRTGNSAGLRRNSETRRRILAPNALDFGQGDSRDGYGRRRGRKCARRIRDRVGSRVDLHLGAIERSNKPFVANSQ
jgi:hypothetical protein